MGLGDSHDGTTATAEPAESRQADSPQMFFQSVDVRGFRLKIDYDTRHVDLTALQPKTPLLEGE